MELPLILVSGFVHCIRHLSAMRINVKMATQGPKSGGLEFDSMSLCRGQNRVQSVVSTN